MLVVLALLSVALICVTTWGRPLMGSDSALHAGVADNIAEGKGPTIPLTMVVHGFSPIESVEFGDEVPALGIPLLYSVVLSLGNEVGSDSKSAAVPVNALSLAATVVMAAWITYRLSGRAIVAAGLTGLIVMCEPLLVEIHRHVQNDGFYSALSLASLLMLARYLERRRAVELVEAIALAAFALMTRHVGLSLVATGTLAIFLLLRENFSRRALMAIVFGIGTVLPLAIYSLATSFGSGVGFTTLGLHVPEAADYLDGLNSVLRWFVPDKLPSVLHLVGLVLLAGSTGIAIGGWITTRRSMRASIEGAKDPSPDLPAIEPRDATLAKVVVLYIGAYLSVVWVSSAYLDAEVVVSDRYLLPVQPLVVALVVAGVALWLHRRDRPMERELATAMGVACVVALAITTLARGALDPGPDFKLAAVQYVAQLDPDILLFSNDPSMIYLTTGRTAYVVPAVTYRQTGAPNEHLERDLAELDQIFDTRRVLILNSRIVAAARPYLISTADLQRQLGLVVVEQNGELTLLGRPGVLDTPGS